MQEHFLIGAIPTEMARAISPEYVEARRSGYYLPDFYDNRVKVAVGDVVLTYDNWTEQFYFVRVIGVRRTQTDGTVVRVSDGRNQWSIDDCVILPKAEATPSATESL